MSKATDFLTFLKNNVKIWACSMCGSGSNQPAAIFREVKNMGYHFEEVSPNRWAKTMYCPKCGTKRTHYKLLSATPEFPEKERFGFDAEDRKRIIKIFDCRDAFSGASIMSTPEIDHKKPWTRLDKDYDVKRMSDDEIKDSFQLLTREHNLLKDRMCKKCKNDKIRTPFFGISFWYLGDIKYNNSCVGCGWYDGIRWRNEINKLIKSITAK